MGVLHDDNLRPRKSKVLSQHEARDNVENMTKQIHGFILGKACEQDIPREQILSTINPEEGCDFAPEAYLSSAAPPNKANLIELFGTLAKAKIVAKGKQRQCSAHLITKLWHYPLRNFIQRVTTRMLPNLKNFPEGNVPVISATAGNNGIAAWKQVPDADQVQGCISISKVHNTKTCRAFWHPYRFTAITQCFW